MLPPLESVDEQKRNGELLMLREIRGFKDSFTLHRWVICMLSHLIMNWLGHATAYFLEI